MEAAKLYLFRNLSEEVGAVPVLCQREPNVVHQRSAIGSIADAVPASGPGGFNFTSPPPFKKEDNQSSDSCHDGYSPTKSVNHRPTHNELPGLDLDLFTAFGESCHTSHDLLTAESDDSFDALEGAFAAAFQMAPLV